MSVSELLHIVTPSPVTQSKCHDISRLLISLREKVVTCSLSNGQIPTERIPVVTCYTAALPRITCYPQSSSLIGHLVLRLNSHWLQVSLWSSGSSPGSTGSFRERKQDTGQNKSLSILSFLKHKENVVVMK